MFNFVKSATAITPTSDISVSSPNQDPSGARDTDI